MAKDLKMVQKYCQVSKAEEVLLSSSAAPIVLLTIKNNTLSSQVAPKQKKLGFMCLTLRYIIYYCSSLIHPWC
ncbi:hypothetical protein BSPWISOXPB_2254 [uncultured Gammaproteobacteria bacterium]|nr:hypothetical protein BSPWISOXPB_2254 [uncultured Gammaproteobacteria bacterium]